MEFLTDEGIERARMKGARLRSGHALDATKAFFSIAHEPRVELAPLWVVRSTTTATWWSIDTASLPSTASTRPETSPPVNSSCRSLRPKEPSPASPRAMSLRGGNTAPGAPDPGPDPKAELED